MDEQKKTSGSLALNSTPRVITIAPSTPVRDRKLRVAAYARVSSSSEDQLNSFAAQNAHYTELITANPESHQGKSVVHHRACEAAASDQRNASVL